jgi:hypothetical protein
VRLPSAPLLAVFERAAIAQGYPGDQAVGDKRGEGLATFCLAVGICERTIQRARLVGTIDLGTADRIAVSLGLRPILIWPAEYNRWLDVLTIAEMEDLDHYEHRREMQRYHQRARGAA